MSDQLHVQPATDIPSRELTYIDYFGAIGGDIARLVKAALSERAVFAVVMSLSLIAGVGTALFSQDTFQADTILAPSSSGGQRGLGGVLSGQLGAVSSLIGMPGDHTAEEMVISLNSRAILYKFIADYNIKKEMFPRLWDDERHQWRLVTPGVLSRGLRWISGRPDAPTQYGPTTEDTYRALTGILSVGQQQSTGMITLSIQWKDPEKAALWANGIVRILNDARRHEAISKSRLRITLLQSELASTTSVETRQVLVNLIQSETENAAVAQTEPQFVLRSLDPAVVPQYRIWPKRGLIIVLSLIFGAFAGGVTSLIWKSLRQHGVIGSSLEQRARHSLGSKALS